MAAGKIKQNRSGNTSIDKTAKGGDKINTKNANDRISAELWMEHFANTLVHQNAIDDKTYKKLMSRISAEINRRYGAH